MAITFQKLLRDPLSHFLVIGGILFAFFSWSGQTDLEAPHVIRLTAGEITAMQKFWEKTHLRLPTESELEGMIENRIKEEVLSRKALALGISVGDTLIRRRLAQKMEFLSEGLVDPGEPSEEDLQTHMKANPEQFQEPTRISFEHIFLNPERHGENLHRVAQTLLVSIQNSNNSKNVSTAGDPTLLNSHFELITPTSLGGLFGEEFVAAMMKLPLGDWQGPVRSPYGLHLVYISQREEAHMPEFNAIRNKVREALLEKRRRDAATTLYKSLRESYHIVVERPGSREAVQSFQDQRE